ncbi:hypothetical protein NIES4101_62140 [Calothrix sp. NIES-4101]|nr:hypothetical protein NIES4101_62140 [Calothrix sp. NIES-4101]
MMQNVEIGQIPQQLTKAISPLKIGIENAFASDNLKTVEISFYNHEIYAENKLIATITHDVDDFVTQRWVVMVNGQEIYRSNTWAKCHSYIRWHYKQGTFPEQQQEPEPTTTGNEIMSQITTECEKFEFYILNDGIYYNDTKLGEVGCSNGNWWVTRASCPSRKVPCDSAFDAVWSLWATEIPLSIDDASLEQLLDQPFETLTTSQWAFVKGYELLPEIEEVAA